MFYNTIFIKDTCNVRKKRLVPGWIYQERVRNAARCLHKEGPMERRHVRRQKKKK